MSAYSIARQQVEGALEAARAGGIDGDVVLRALLSTLVERYRELKGVEDLRAVLQFQMENCRGDEDYMFMRP